MYLVHLRWGQSVFVSNVTLKQIQYRCFVFCFLEGDFHTSSIYYRICAISILLRKYTFQYHDRPLQYL